MNPPSSPSRDIPAAGSRDGTQIRLSLPGEARQVTVARAFVARHLGPDADIAVLLVSELVTNSVLHAPRTPGAQVTVVLTGLAEGAVRIEVTDQGGSSVPRPGPRDRDMPESGRGLELVGALSRRWGYRTEPGGMLVTWCDVDGVLVPHAAGLRGGRYWP
jgi:anti-sigma regulatory factor (Ser/Thr protein kinase)